MEDPLAAIRVTFFQECEEQLAELESGLIAMENGTAETETVNAVFRAVHSMKGGAGIFSLDFLVRFAHVFETALDKVRSGALVASPAVVAVFLRAADLLADLVRAAREEGAVDEARIAAMAREFEQIDGVAAGNEKDTPKPEETKKTAKIVSWNILFTPYTGLYAKANEAAVLLRELRRLGETKIELDSSHLPELHELDPEGAYLTWNIVLESECGKQDIRNIFEFVEDDCKLEISEQNDESMTPGTVITGDNGFKFEFFAPMEPEEAGESKEEEPAMSSPGMDKQEVEHIHQAQHSPLNPTVQVLAAKVETTNVVGTTIRVDLDRVDRMIDLVGELVINEAMLSQRVMEAGIARASGVAMALEELEHLTREIQDSVMAIRAQPVRSVFQRMPRLVREVAALTGKQVHLVSEGEATEVDKTVIERIADPLTHMIRNAIDHGLESTQVRIEAGKPAEGTVKLTAVHRSGRIVLEVSDDGGGINRARVRQKAIENGLITPDTQMTDEEVDNLIFLPGFSTASKVSDISGRGVGMDVVRQSVQALGGRISISSRPGVGSTFTLSLPLTLAVLDGMVVSAKGHTLIIPLGAIVETLKPRSEDVFPLDGDLNMLALRGGYVPIVDVAFCLGYSKKFIEPEQSVALLVEGDGGARAVLLVDAIHGQRQVVIKSLEANYRAVPGIAAATVMGDGRVALIVDVDMVVRDAGADTSIWPTEKAKLEVNGRAA
ncbi:chemotaxis protein CheA [Acidocella sp.]|uniref:chemotaxis protein CheA n=1 Tax=Acidocella sp. TaxID=50710 RepID=UPI003D014D01